MLEYLQSLSKEDRDNVALLSNNIDRAKSELERMMISKEEEDKYLQMIEETKKMITEKTPPTPELGCQRIRQGDEKKKVKGQLVGIRPNPPFILTHTYVVI